MIWAHPFFDKSLPSTTNSVITLKEKAKYSAYVESLPDVTSQCSPVIARLVIMVTISFVDVF
jgi:hypothetical protein